jgi:hypothetical protein
MIVENESEMRKLKPPKVKGVKKLKKKKQAIKHYKGPNIENFFVCCY